jgi:prepilin-type N-terminal cleavage/methylation domain-containing protein
VPRAFTLVEVIMVLLVLGIAAAMVVPAVGSNLYAARLKTAANVLASDIEFCQSECIAQPSAPRAVVLDVASNTYKLVVFSSNATIKHPADGQNFVNDFATGRNAQLSGVSITAVTGGTPATLTFDGYGRPLITADMVITLAFSGQTMTVTVAKGTGDVSITN